MCACFQRIATGGLFLLSLAGILFIPCSSFANNPGGFTTLVTTAVTTGTETVNGHADRYLDNGILHVSIQNNGSVDSIKYLKPGSAGTPSANGTEMVSQSGVNFGNHTAIYYYWYPDGNGDAAYLNTTIGSTNVDIAYLRAYNPASDSVVADVELHYALGKGNTGLYCYIIVRHPASFAVYTNNLDISFIQCIWPTAHDNTNFLCENQYLDDYTKYGLFINGVQQKRNGLQPNFYDGWHTTNVAGMPKEIVQYTTGVFTGSTNGKYSFTLDYPKISTFGMASDTNKLGLWYVSGGHEYQNNGPTACEYAGGIGGLLLYEPLIAHYNNTGLTVSSNADWAKIYGPWLLYFNSQSNGAACWADSQSQAVAEKFAWPYAWLTNSLYQSRSQRAIICGKLVISDPLRPQATAAGAWVGLAAPDSGLENDPNNWQYQSDGYQFWTQCAADGSFTLPPVTTVSPYGGPASYKLYAYCAGTNGSVGEFQTAPFTFTSGTVTNLGTLTWKVPHSGSQVLWEIGYPDRTAAKYRHGDEYGRPALWLGFSNEFTSPLEYYVASNNWATALNYAHTVDYTASTPWKWHLNFNLPSVKSGTYWLNIAYATADSYQIVRVNNDGSYVADFIPQNGTPGTTTMIRQGIHSKYVVAHVPIPSSLLIAGANFITLDHEYHTDHGNDNFMYDYISLEAPLPQLTWRGDGAANLWDIGFSADWFDGIGAVAYNDLSPVTFDNTGSSSPVINLDGTLQPASVMVNADKDYTFSGGSLFGNMTLIKMGTGRLALNNSNSYTGGTTISNGTVLVNGLVSSPVNVVAGTIGGSGAVVANVTLQSGTALAPGQANLPGTFSIANTLVETNYTDTNDDLVTSTYFITNNLALTNNNLIFHFASTTNIGGGVNDLVQLNGGTLTLAGTSTVNPQLTGGSLAAGNYTLITGGSSTVGGTANLGWAGPTTGTRQTCTLDASTPGTVLLLVTNNAGIPPLAGGPLLWRGTNGNTWDLATTTNWSNAGAADLFYNFDVVSFDDTSPNGTVAITGTVQPGGVLVSNISRTYTISGGTLGGIGALVKNGSGTLNLSGANTYTGGTILNAGTIQLGNVSGAGSGVITLAGGTLGVGATKPANTINVIATSTVTGGSGGGLAGIGKVTGSGTMNVNITTGVFDLIGDLTSFTGTMIFGSANGCRLNGTAGSSFATFDLGSGTGNILVRNSVSAFALGGLAGGVNTILAGNNSFNTAVTYTVGANNLSTFFNGKIVNGTQASTPATSITKTGTGTLTLTGANTYTGATIITGGTLQIGNGGTSGTLGTAAVTDGGTLAFNRSDANNDSVFGLISGGGSFAQNGSGTFTFTKAQPYSGSTFINAGTLALSGSGAIASSANIAIAAGALFDVSSTTSGNLTLASGQTLSGNGSVKGSLIVGSGATLSPGNPLGTLTFSNALTLAAGGTALMAVSHSPLTNDTAKVFSALTNGGSLLITNPGASTLAAGDNFKLFNAGSYHGAFASVSLPALATGLAWNTNSLNTAGTLSVISIIPHIAGTSVFGTNLVSTGSGGLQNGNYYVLASTNLAQPLANWTRLTTNAYDADGNFRFTNGISPGAPQNFYLIQLP